MQIVTNSLNSRWLIEQRSPFVAKQTVAWKKQPEPQDLLSATNYLSLLLPAAKVKMIARRFRRAGTAMHAAKDLLRAANLPLLPKYDPHVEEDLKRIRKGKPLAPVLLVRGDSTGGIPLTIADGYHRICAICYVDENVSISCRLVSE
jgi:hypothetical protein